MPRRYRRSRRGTRRSRRGRRGYRRSGRRYGNRRREMAFQDATSSPFTTTYRRRRTSGRSYSNYLYNSTRFKAHYRSTFEGSGQITTGTSIETANVHLHRALFSSGARGGGEPFYSPLGGALPIDGTTPVPEFDGNIVLRGGVARVSVYNTSGSESCRVEVISVWSIAHPLDRFASDFTAPAEWDPSLVSEFNQFGKVIARKVTVLRPKASMIVSHKFKIQKLDQPQFEGIDGITSDTPSANTLFWFIKVIPMATVSVVANYMTSFNVSFCGDAITPGLIPLRGVSEAAA